MSTNDNYSEHGADTLPQGEREIDAHLQRAGTRWRASSSEVDAIAARLRARASQMTADHVSQHGAAAPASPARLRTISAPRTARTNLHTRRPALTQASGLVAVLAMVVVVGALAALFRHPAGTTSTGPSLSPRGQWVALDGLNADAQFDANALPAIAPSDPRVVYETLVYGSQQHKPGSIRRTDDSGATWHTLPLPIAAAHVSYAAVLVSPLDAHSAFLTLNSTAVSDCPANQVQTNSENGSSFCSLQYTSTDGGAHWSTTVLPMPSELKPGTATFGATTIQAGSVGGHSYLYAQAICTLGTCSRLVASADGGRSWHFADASLVAAGMGHLCAVISDPHGSALFAVAATTDCAADASVLPTIWRSDDAGAHWSRVGTLTTPNVFGALGARLSNSNATALYVAQPRVVSTTTKGVPLYSADPTDLKASVDAAEPGPPPRRVEFRLGSSRTMMSAPSARWATARWWSASLLRGAATTPQAARCLPGSRATARGGSLRRPSPGRPTRCWPSTLQGQRPIRST